MYANNNNNNKLDAHCLDKRAYFCRLLRSSKARGRLDPFSSCFESQALWAVARERRTYTQMRCGGGEMCVVECKIELTFVKLGASYYGIVDVERKMELMFVKLGAAYYGMWESMILLYNII